jgi:hypothetical protein
MQPIVIPSNTKFIQKKENWRALVKQTTLLLKILHYKSPLCQPENEISEEHLINHAVRHLMLSVN